MVTDTAPSARSSSALLTAVVSGSGVVVSFVEAIAFFARLSPHATRSAVDVALGVPSVAVSLVFFAVVLTATVAGLAGARFGRGWFNALGAVVAIGTVYQLVVIVTSVTWFSIVLVALAALLLVLAIRSAMSASATAAAGDRLYVLGIFLVLAGLAGLTASMNLTFDDVIAHTSGGAQSCDFSPFVQCSANLGSRQGSLLGFPNPLIGLGGFAVPLVVGIALLFGARFARWFWIAFNVGVVFAFAFVIFLIVTSIYFLGTLCLWCALVWTFTIPMFWLVTLYNLKSGNLRVGPRATRFFEGAYTWVPLVSLVCYLVVGVLFQAQLNVLQYF